MATEHGELIDRIRSAFPPKVLPFRGVTRPEDYCGEEKEVSDRVAGRTWQDLSDEEALSTPACFLAPSALAKLIPAFIIERLKANSPPWRVDEMLLIEYGNETSFELAQELNQEQRSVIVQYLEIANSRGDSAASLALVFWAKLLE